MKVIKFKSKTRNWYSLHIIGKHETTCIDIDKWEAINICKEQKIAMTIIKL